MNIMDSRYTLEEQLGKGGMGVVYRAFDHLEGQHIALKRIEVDPVSIEMNPIAASPRYQHMILAHEFKTLASLRHPNIISVLDYGFTSKRQPFFAMELLEAPRNVLEAGQALDTKGKVDLLIQMLQAITYLHHHRIMHRDLKPNNVLVTEDGQVKVLDFGLAVKEGEVQDHAGTIFYMAPELMSHEPATEASDLYAVGIIIYEMFTGTRPFAGKYQREVAEQILKTPPNMSPFDQLAENDPAIGNISKVVGCLLEKQPENRYPDALAVICDLCRAIDEPLPPDEGAIRESFLQAATFVGRTAEIEKLQWALTQAKDRHGSTWLVGGESGIGKSRLLDELRIYALTEDVIVLRGQISEGKDSLAECWGKILRPLLLSISINESEASALKTIIPDIESLLGIELPATSDSEGDASWLYFVIAQIFSRISHRTLLLLEDLQWATTTLEPLKMLVPLIADVPLMIVGSYRSDEAPHLPDQINDANLIKLDKLSYDDVAELSNAMLGNIACAPNVLDRLYQETEGNAFFMVEVVRAWAEEVGQLSEINHSELPESVLTGGIKHVIERRLQKVPRWAYEGLQVAAVMGRQLDLDVLHEILAFAFSLITGKGVSVSISTVWREERTLNLNDWLLICADAAILEVQDGDWRFTHDKLREQILAQMSDDDITVINRRIKKAATALAAKAS